MPDLDTSLYRRSEVKAPTPPAAIAINNADMADGAPRTPTAAEPEKAKTAVPAGAATPPVPTVAYAENAAIPIAPAATAHATFPVALSLMVFFARFPSISIVSSLSFKASPSSFSVLTFLTTLVSFLSISRH